MSVFTTPERVWIGVEYLDARRPGWRDRALMLALTGTNLRVAAEREAGPRPAFYDPGQIHAWNLAHGITIDFSALGYPAAPDETPRWAREMRAWAELDAAWWRVLADEPA